MMAAALRYRVGKIRSITGRERLDLGIAQLALLRALYLVRTRPTGELIRPASPGTGAASPTAEQVARLDALALAVERAAEHGLFRATCLVRAVALEHLIVRTRVTGAVVRIGVMKGDSGLLAHAWIELAGRVLGDRPENVRRFTPLQDFSALAS